MTLQLLVSFQHTTSCLPYLTDQTNKINNIRQCLCCGLYGDADAGVLAGSPLTLCQCCCLYGDADAGVFWPGPL